MLKKKKSFLGQLFQPTFQTELWPPRFSDLNLCNYYLWRTLKDRVYVNNLFFTEAKIIFEQKFQDNSPVMHPDILSERYKASFCQEFRVYFFP